MPKGCFVPGTAGRERLLSGTVMPCFLEAARVGSGVI